MKKGVLACIVIIGVAALGSLFLWHWLGEPPAASISPSSPISRSSSSPRDVTPISSASPSSTRQPSDTVPRAQSSSSHSASSELVLKGRVVRSDGSPVPLATIRAWEWEDPRFFVDTYEAFAAEVEPREDGSFEIAVDRQGEFRAWASATGECSSEVITAKLNPRTPSAEVELVLPSPQWIRGKVVDQEGRPAARVRLIGFVDVERFGGDLPVGLTSIEAWGRLETNTSEEGTFELFPVDPRASGYELQAYPRRLHSILRSMEGGGFEQVRTAEKSEVPRVAPGSEGVVVTLDDWVDTLAKAELQVSVKGVNEPPAEVHYELRHVGPHGSVYSTRSKTGKLGPQGTVVIPDLLAGARYQVCLDEPYLPDDVCSETFVASLGTRQVPIELPFSVQVELGMRDANGAPAQEVSLFVRTQPEDGMNTRLVHSSYKISTWPIHFRLAPGTYRVEAKGPRNSRCVEELVVEDVAVRLALELGR